MVNISESYNFRLKNWSATTSSQTSQPTSTSDDKRCGLGLKITHNSSQFSFISIFTGAFRLYDVDNDGFITRDEMYNIVDAIYQMVVCNTLVLFLHVTYRVIHLSLFTHSFI